MCIYNRNGQTGKQSTIFARCRPFASKSVPRNCIVSEMPEFLRKILGDYFKT